MFTTHISKIRINKCVCLQIFCLLAFLVGKFVGRFFLRATRLVAILPTADKDLLTFIYLYHILLFIHYVYYYLFSYMYIIFFIISRQNRCNIWYKRIWLADKLADKLPTFYLLLLLKIDVSIEISTKILPTYFAYILFCYFFHFSTCSFRNVFIFFYHFCWLFLFYMLYLFYKCYNFFIRKHIVLCFIWGWATSLPTCLTLPPYFILQRSWVYASRKDTC